MTIHPLFQDSALSPEEMEILAHAYEDALLKLELKPRIDRITELVARKAIEVWQRGVRDRGEITKKVVDELLDQP